MTAQPHLAGRAWQVGWLPAFAHFFFKNRLCLAIHQSWLYLGKIQPRSTAAGVRKGGNMASLMSTLQRGTDMEEEAVCHFLFQGGDGNGQIK